MINIGIECSSLCTNRPTGIARYTTNLIDALLEAKDFEKIFNLELFYKLSRYENRNFRYLPSGIKTKWYFGNILPLKKGIDIFHCPEPKTIPWKKPKKVVTIHDLAIFKSRFQYENFSPKAFREKKRRDYEKAMRTVNSVITISQSTKNDVIELLKVPEEKICVVYPGVDKIFLRRDNNDIEDQEVLDSLEISDVYFLFVGAVSVRKNLVNLIKAFNISGLAERYRLILTGELSHGWEEIWSTIKGLKLEKRIQLLGYVPDSALPVLYSNAAAFLFPTFYEGFGLPIFEAMACGTPVMIGGEGAAPEIALGHAIVVDPHDVNSIAEGINKSLSVNASSLEEAKRYAGTFTWNRCVDKTINLYKQIL